LLGGQIFPDTQTSNIYRASVASPTSWSLWGQLPYAMSFGQAITFGNDNDGYMYVFGPGTGADNTGETAIVRAPLHDLSTSKWKDVARIPAVISHSQIAFIYDRLWFFGGSGLSAIFTCWQKLKYNLYGTLVVAYGETTRALFHATDNKTYPFMALGYPYWKTDFGPVIF